MYCHDHHTRLCQHVCKDRSVSLLSREMANAEVSDCHVLVRPSANEGETNRQRITCAYSTSLPYLSTDLAD